MKNFNQFSKTKVSFSKTLYIFIDESGVYNSSKIKKWMKSKKYTKYNIPYYFNVSALLISRDKFLSLGKDVENIKKQSNFSHENFKHRADYSYKRFNELVDNKYDYSESIKYLAELSELVMKYKLKSFSVGYNFSLMSYDTKLNSIYLNTVKALLNEVKNQIENDKKLKKYDNVIFVFEKTNNIEITREIEKLSKVENNNKYKYLWTYKGNVGNELSDLVAFNNGKYYGNHFYLQTRTSAYDFPNHTTKSLKVIEY